MASIRKEVLIECGPAVGWDAVRDVGAVHTRVAPGFLTACRMEDAPLLFMSHTWGKVRKKDRIGST